jgi:hypothetical protein
VPNESALCHWFNPFIGEFSVPTFHDLIMRLSSVLVKKNSPGKRGTALRRRRPEGGSDRFPVLSRDGVIPGFPTDSGPIPQRMESSAEYVRERGGESG